MGEPVDRNTMAGSGELQPSGVLNRVAMSGRFSLQYILSSGENAQPPLPDKTVCNLTEDPIQLGIVNLAIAKCLYE